MHMFSSKSVEVVDITDDNGDATVSMTFKMELEGIPKPKARPRLGKNCFFYTPGNKKEMKALKARIKSGVPGAPLFGSDQPASC